MTEFNDWRQQRVLRWWGYLLTDGSIHTRRYFDDPGDIDEAKESDFVEHVVQPFGSCSKANAEKTVEIECMKHLASLK